MSHANTMDLATARRLLTLVPYDRRLPVGQFQAPHGIVPGFVRGFVELEFVLMPQKRSLPGVDMARLADWIEKDVGDPVGAGQVREAAAAAPSYVEACKTVYERVRERAEVARDVAESAAASERRA